MARSRKANSCRDLLIAGNLRCLRSARLQWTLMVASDCGLNLVIGLLVFATTYDVFGL
jgi:hypothetical protein